MTSKTPLLDTVHTPDDLKKISKSDLPALANELRVEMIDAVSGIGGHFGAGLGVIELTTALHYVFNTPEDKIVWDVSHQTYPHKILTGRRDRIRSIRQKDGLYGFTKRYESEYDPFGAGHSSTSLSAGFGMSIGRDFAGKSNKVISVVGDGAATGGMIYEALLNAGASASQFLVILNDNGMSIAPAEGALTNYLNSVVQCRGLMTDTQIAEHIETLVNSGATSHTELAQCQTFFEQLGFHYIGPVDGHNLDHLVPVLETIRDKTNGPVFLHIITEKGKGHPFETPHKENYHAVGKFCPETGVMAPKAASVLPTYTKVYADSLIEHAKNDDKIVTITAAMPSGTGLDIFGTAFPERTFDVGIAEQHAVTFAAGLACEGMKPFCTIYSTFLQRGYDQVIHDVALQNLPVRFAMDRAGLVGNDGATHAGSFDLAYLSCLPNMMIMAAGDEAELMHMVATAAAYDDGPSALRYPRGTGLGVDLPKAGQVLEIGKGRVLKDGTNIAILSLGGRLGEALKAAETLEMRGLSTTVADARFAKPLDIDLIERLAREHEVLITIEEGSSGGFGAHVLTHLARKGALDKGLKIRPMTIPDKFISHGSPTDQYVEAGLMANDIVNTALEALGKSDSGAIYAAQ
ncbi:MAG: 1-deoxy-D-xylulose-5-phosphate synthase [Litorimonas sp.]